jgi:hypothetical protein
VFYLVQTHADVKFRLNSEGSPLNLAKVKLNGDSLITNSLGIALFKQILLDGQYSYSISKSGYFDQAGDFYLSKDTVIDVSVEKWPLGIEQSMDKGKFKVWPNPATDFLYCSFPANYLNSTLFITDLVGKEIFSREINEPELTIPLKNYPSGAYILRIQTGNEYNSRLFFRN